jgi:hypothetical protein
MTTTVWASRAMMDSTLILPVTADLVARDRARAAEGMRRAEAGEALGAEWFAGETWIDAGARKAPAFRALFYANGYWVVSDTCAEALRSCDMGQGA